MARRKSRKKLSPKQLKEIGITSQEAKKIRSFTGKKKLAFRVPPISTLEPETREWIRRVAYLLGVSRSTFFRYCLEKNESLIVLLGDRGTREMYYKAMTAKRY